MVSENHCVYVKKTTKGIMFLSLYVDNILLAGNNIETIQTTEEWLSFFFELKDKGEARYVLGIEIIRNRSTKFLCLS